MGQPAVRQVPRFQVYETDHRIKKKLFKVFSPQAQEISSHRKSNMNGKNLRVHRRILGPQSENPQRSPGRTVTAMRGAALARRATASSVPRRPAAKLSNLRVQEESLPFTSLPPPLHPFLLPFLFKEPFIWLHRVLG